jgi:ligand-binding sensor domain-containing protein
VMTLPGHEITRADNGGIVLNGVTDLALCQDTLYIGTPGGLFKGSVRARRFAFMPLDPGLLNAPILEISVRGSQVWLATAEGIQVYDQATGQSKSWYANAWLNNAEPTCICATDSFVWVGTRENGFYRYRLATGEWISYTTADGLVDNRVQVIRRDGDDLLIGTASGLTRFYWNRPGRIR